MTRAGPSVLGFLSTLAAPFLIALLLGLPPGGIGSGPSHVPLPRAGPSDPGPSIPAADRPAAGSPPVTPPSVPPSAERPRSVGELPPLPSSSGGRTLPGAEILSGLAARAMARGFAAPNGSDWGDLASKCFGVWPSTGGQSQYLPGCYGHDEPGVDAYSALGGSGGNVTWTVQLPVGTSGTQMQSDLYTAIWFGLPLSDPYSWLNVCFLELQFYPDTSDPGAASGSSPNNWTGAAVAWQIEAASGAEVPCYYQTLNVNVSNGPYLVMHGGDTIVVRMTGWVGSRTGENLQVLDQSTRQNAPITMFDNNLSLPLDPAYGTSSYSNGLMWTPGGQLPVSFAYEIGHTVPPFPNNNSYGGCSAGVPPPSRQDGAVPCPSYDPGSWVADTRSPWEISPPTFFNASTSATASQVAFTQDLGGISVVDPLSNGTCTGRDGSAWCSYPWYSYSCASHAFEFGATDWPTTSADFGQYRQYAVASVIDRAQLGYYPPTNFSVPACGAPSASLTVGASPGGSASFLGRSYTTNSSVAGLLSGDYSLSATPGPGSYFEGWLVQGGAVLASPDCPVTTVQVLSAGGSVYARFGSTPVTVSVRFDGSDPNGSVQVVPGFAGLNNPPSTTVRSGGTLQLAPGVYSINALPPPGSNFTNWSVRSGGAFVAAPGLPFTWITVTGSGSAPDVYVQYTPTPSVAMFYLLFYESVGAGGTITLNGTTNYTGFAQFGLPVGSYRLSESAPSGTIFLYWYFGGISVTLDFSNSTEIAAESGDIIIEAVFTLAANVTIATAGGAGRVQIDGGSWLASGSTVPLTFPPLSVTVAALAPANEVFTGWSVSNAAALSVRARSASVTTLLVNASATLTAHFAATSPPGLGFRVSPARAGEILFGDSAYGNGSSNASLAPGLYPIGFLPATGFRFSHWTTAGGVNVTTGTRYGWPSFQSVANLSASGATLTAVAIPAPAPVTFLTAPVAAGVSFTVNGSALADDSTTGLLPGPVVVDLIGAAPSGRAFRSWNATGNLTVLASNDSSATIWANGSGALEAIFGPALLLSVSVSPGSGAQAPVLETFNETSLGGVAPFEIDWYFTGSSGSGLWTNTTNAPSGNSTYGLNYTDPGVFSWSVRLVDALARVGSASGSIVIGGPPLSVSSLVSPLNGTAPLTVALSLNASGGAAPYQLSWWIPSLGTALPGSQSQYTFTQPGSYLMMANATDAGGFLAQRSTLVSVYPPLEVTATASPLSGTAPLTVSFQAAGLSGVGADTFNWSFGDGAYSSSAVTSHVYTQPGQFTANVTATDARGDTASKSFTIQVNAPPPPLVARLLAIPGTLYLGNGTELKASATGGRPDSTGAYHYWYNASTLPPGCSAAPGPIFNCTPTAVGNYTIEVVVNDSARSSAVATATLVVERTPPVTKPIESTTTGITVPLTVWIGLGAGAAVAILLAALILRRGRSGPRTAPAPDGPGPGTPDGPSETAVDEDLDRPISPEEDPPAGEGPTAFQ